MSYTGVGEYYETGLGSYFTFAPHEVYDGIGSAGCAGCAGCNGIGCVGCPGCGSFGVVTSTLDVDQVMADIATSDKCYGPNPVPGFPQSTCNFAAQRANKAIAVALNELGYGPIAVDGSISWKSAYSRFLSDHGLTKGPGLGITRQALLTMKQKLEAGEAPGPGKKTEYEKVNGEYIPKLEEKIELGGLSGSSLILAALAVGGVGYLVYRAGKKKKGAAGARPRPTTRAMTVAPR